MLFPRFITCIVHKLDLTTSIHIECFYYFQGCNLYHLLNITSPELAVIESASGMEKRNQTNDDVEILIASSLNIHFFPRGLEKVFKNLIKVWLPNNEIKEIHKEDLKPLPKLEYLDLKYNKIEAIEDGLFDYNPKLRIINLKGNKISRIAENVFSNLTGLLYLDLSENSCIDTDPYETKVLEIIKQIKTRCGNGEKHLRNRH